MIDSTIYLNEESERKQVSMPVWAYEALKRAANGTAMTKGLVAYEALLLENDKYEDAFTAIESEVDDQFVDVVGTDSLAFLQKKKFAARSEGIDELVRRVADGDPHETAERVNLHLPVSLTAQMEGRGLGSEIAHALAGVQIAPWSSRIERCDIKRQLITHARGDHVADPHPFVEAVMAEDPSHWDIDPMLPDFEFDNWWESPNVTFDLIHQRGTEIPNTHTWRVPALQAAVNNAEGAVTRSDVVDAAMDGMHVSTPETARKYADRIDFSESGGVEVDFVADGLTQLAEMARDKMPDGHPKENLPAHELLLIDEEVYDVDGAYPSEEDARDALESVRYMTDAGSASAPFQTKANAAFFQWLDREIEAL
ncbi:hypothetical protein [Haloferax sulfurifontis]|uniref:Uncharacterized protein n=1 Tax=Haloferax sulfurifontis TaxID=255616 RepID=A0A830DX95_9EURY|nr:hypothetical protein [Haloferax sulfurifontis]GGC49927.1 hypothetical protein GCM10007209_09490 [Haloferax sulfurifontis]